MSACSFSDFLETCWLWSFTVSRQLLLLHVASLSPPACLGSFSGVSHYSKQPPVSKRTTKQRLTHSKCRKEVHIAHCRPRAWGAKHGSAEAAVLAMCFLLLATLCTLCRVVLPRHLLSITSCLLYWSKNEWEKNFSICEHKIISSWIPTRSSSQRALLCILRSQ